MPIHLLRVISYKLLGLTEDTDTECTRSDVQQRDDDIRLEQVLFLVLMLLKALLIPKAVSNISHCKHKGTRKVRRINYVMVLHLLSKSLSFPSDICLLASVAFLFDGPLRLITHSKGYPLQIFLMLEDTAVIILYSALAIGAQIW